MALTGGPIVASRLGFSRRRSDTRTFLDERWTARWDEAFRFVSFI